MAKRAGHGIMLSVVIPVYNVEKYLRECLDSVVCQNYGQVEILCIDDGSTDDSLSILREYEEMYPQIRVYTKENGGLPSARNYGMARARGKYLYFLDSDDYLQCKDSFSTMVREMEEGQLSILYFNTRLVFENAALRKERHRDIAWFRKSRTYGFYDEGCDLFADMIQHWDWVCNVWIQCIRRDFLEQNQVSFLDVYGCEDEFYTFRTMLLAQRVKHISRQLHCYRIQPGSIMSTAPSFRAFYGGVRSWRKVLQFLGASNLPPHVRDAILILLRRRSRDLDELYRRLVPSDQQAIDTLPEGEREIVRMFLDFREIMGQIGASYVFPYHLFPPQSRVAIYGAGNVGKEFYHGATRSGYLRVAGIVDRSAGKMDFGRMPVQPIADLKRMDYDYILIAVEAEDTALAIKKALVRDGVREQAIKWDGRRYLREAFRQDFYFPHLGKLHEIMKTDPAVQAERGS